MFPRLLRRCLSAFPQYAPVCSLYERLHRASARPRSFSRSFALCARRRKALSTDLAKLSFTRSLGRRVHACQEAEISIFIALHNCLASFRCGRRGKNPNLSPPPGEWSERSNDRASAHTQKQHHHLEYESISILFASDLFFIHGLTNHFYGGQ